jgi:hypothetical protein
MHELLSTLERIANALEQIDRHLVAARDTAAPVAAREVSQPPVPPGDGLPEMRSMAASLGRLADALAPRPADVVGTPYVAGRLGCSTVWVAEPVRQGRLPAGCVVPGTGNGKPWKFYRGRVDEWIETR